MSEIVKLLEAFVALYKEPSSETKHDFDQAYHAYQTHKTDHADDNAIARVAYRVDAIVDELRYDDLTPRERLAHDVRNMHRSDAAQHNKFEDELRDLPPRERFLRMTENMWRRGQ
jgi:hypothetical protein